MCLPSTGQADWTRCRSKVCFGNAPRNHQYFWTCHDQTWSWCRSTRCWNAWQNARTWQTMRTLRLLSNWGATGKFRPFRFGEGYFLLYVAWDLGETSPEIQYHRIAATWLCRAIDNTRVSSGWRPLKSNNVVYKHWAHCSEVDCLPWFIKAFPQGDYHLHGIPIVISLQMYVWRTSCLESSAAWQSRTDKNGKYWHQTQF